MTCGSHSVDLKRVRWYEGLEELPGASIDSGKELNLFMKMGNGQTAIRLQPMILYGLGKEF